MIRNAVWCLAAAVGSVLAPGAVFAQSEGWQADHDAGWAAYREGRFAGAETLLRSAAEKARAFGPDDPRLATTLDHLAWVLCTEERPDEGEAWRRRPFRSERRPSAPSTRTCSRSLNTVACLYDMDGKPKEAKPAYERCLALAEKLDGKEHPNVAAVLDNLATVEHALGEAAEAEATYKRDPSHPGEGAEREAARPRPDPPQPRIPLRRGAASTPTPSRS